MSKNALNEETLCDALYEDVLAVKVLTGQVYDQVAALDPIVQSIEKIFLAIPGESEAAEKLIHDVYPLRELVTAAWESLDMSLQLLYIVQKRVRAMRKGTDGRGVKKDLRGVLAISQRITKNIQELLEG